MNEAQNLPTEPGYYWFRDIDEGCGEAFEWEPLQVTREPEEPLLARFESVDKLLGEWGPPISTPDEIFDSKTDIDDLNDQLEAAMVRQQREELRDTFAAVAVEGILAHRGCVSPTHPPGEVSWLAIDAYAIADAMLAERDKNA